VAWTRFDWLRRRRWTSDVALGLQEGQSIRRTRTALPSFSSRTTGAESFKIISCFQGSRTGFAHRPLARSHSVNAAGEGGRRLRSPSGGPVWQERR